MKQGGWSYNTGWNSKKGITQQHKCSVCGRIYKQTWTRDRHEKFCREHNKGDAR